MKFQVVKKVFFLLASVLILFSCSGTKLTQEKVNTAFTGEPVSDILVIVVADNDKTRKYFENQFVVHLKAAGLEAVSSAEAIPMPPDLKMEKSTIVEAVKKYENDAVLITQLVGLEDKEVYTRSYSPGAFSGYGGFYGGYGFAYSYAHDPGYSREKITVLLENKLYDVKTEKLIWSGQSKTWNKNSKKEIINDNIKLVVKELQAKKLIKPKG